MSSKEKIGEGEEVQNRETIVELEVITQTDQTVVSLPVPYFTMQPMKRINSSFYDGDMIIPFKSATKKLRYRHQYISGSSSVISDAGDSFSMHHARRLFPIGLPGQRKKAEEFIVNEAHQALLASQLSDEGGAGAALEVSPQLILSLESNGDSSDDDPSQGLDVSAYRWRMRSHLDQRGSQLQYRIGQDPRPLGKRLGGPKPERVSIPHELRVRCLRERSECAPTRHWEEEVIAKGILGGRVFVSRGEDYPCAVLSFLSYQPKEEAARRWMQKHGEEVGAEIFHFPKRDWRGLSYGYLLRVEGTKEEELPEAAERPELNIGGVDDNCEHYVPKDFDDPQMIAGRHKQCVVAYEPAEPQVLRDIEQTGPIICSFLKYVNPAELKKELNNQFRDRHPNLPYKLTLSKIRSIKRQTILGCNGIGEEMGTVALAFVFFEKMCLKRIVTKANRRVSMSACLLLALKFSMDMMNYEAHRFKKLFGFFDAEWQISRKQVRKAEFGALVILGFDLHVPPDHVMYHFYRILRVLGMLPPEYLGPVAWAVQVEEMRIFDDKNGVTPPPSPTRRLKDGETEVEFQMSKNSLKQIVSASGSNSAKSYSVRMDSGHKAKQMWSNILPFSKRSRAVQEDTINVGKVKNRRGWIHSRIWGLTSHSRNTSLG